MRRGLVFTLLFALSAPAAAAAAPTDTISMSVRGIQRGGIVEGTVPFQVEASSAAGIRKLEVFIGGTRVGMIEPNNVRQKVELSHDWTTTQLEGSSELAPNGEYAVRARAAANGGGSKETVVKVIVDNPPVTPTGLVAETAGRSVGLTWAANPEPDLLGYEIFRSDGTSYQAVGHTSETTLTDPVGSGTYSYRITAVRDSAARSTGRPSLPSEPVEITLAAPAGGNGRGHTGPSGSAAAARRTGRGFKVDDSAFAPRGLPSGASLPGTIGQTGLPDVPDAAQAWGSYEAELPYEIPEGGIPLSADRAAASDAPWKVIPADGLRWVAAGLLLLVTAALLRLVARRIEVAVPPVELKL